MSPARSRILAVDDEPGILEVVSDTLSDLRDADVHVERDSTRAAARLSSERFDVLITDIRMPDMDGVELLRVARRHDPDVTVLMLTAYPSIETAVESMKLGATDYITKPFIPDDLLATVRRALEDRRLRQENRALLRHVGRDYSFDDIVGGSARMQAVFDTIQRVSQTDVDVLVTGETGTGKELVARSIHRRSSRAEKRFVPVDCGAIPESLLESELFGHERGAFTGANARAIGILELAHGGTFFLDEIAELPLHIQAKLLRVLQERSFRRIGGRDEISVDARVIAATNRELAVEVREGRFREDLYYRINVVNIQISPLRDRASDLPLLTAHFVDRYGRELAKGQLGVDAEVLEIFSRYRWPGNVRELQNVIKRAVALSDRRTLTADDLPDELVMGASGPATDDKGGFFALRAQRVDSFERTYLVRLLEQHEGDVTAAAAAARLPRGTLYRLLKKHELSADDFRA